MEWERQSWSCKLYSCLYISVQCLSFSQQPDVVDFMFSLNRLFSPYPFVKSCYLTSSSLSCIYVNDYSFLCFTCSYRISYCFFSDLYSFLCDWSSSAFNVHPSFLSSALFTFLIQTCAEPKKYPCRTPFNAYLQESTKTSLGYSFPAGFASIWVSWRLCFPCFLMRASWKTIKRAQLHL